MFKGLFCWNSFTRLELYHFIEQINSLFIHICAHFLQTLIRVVDSPLRESGLEVGQIAYALPSFIRWRSHYLKDLEYLPDLWISIEKGKMQPIDHISTAVLYTFCPKRISGALYHRVTTSWVYDFNGRPNVRARPKSASLICSPFKSIKRLLGFKSLCIILL